MYRSLLLFVSASLLLVSVPVEAAGNWQTSASVPATFRPNRSVTFSFTATSQSPSDSPVQWVVDLYTCQDANANGACGATEPQYTSHGSRNLNVLPRQSGTVSWTVNLNQPEGAYRYQFLTRCPATPCVTEPGGGTHDKAGNFQLQYTNSWTRAILATSPANEGSSQTVVYRLTSTNPDDRDLTGTAELYSTPAGGAPTSQGAKPYAASANAATDVTWPNVAFPQTGTQRLRVTDTNAADSTLDMAVRGVHLHAIQPRETYSAGSRFSIYFLLEGHGGALDPQGIVDEIELTVWNGSFIVANATLQTGNDGRAYADVASAHDHNVLAWTARAAGSWQSVNYDLSQVGTIRFSAGEHAALEQNVTAIRANLSELQLKGVHLDDVGARNLWMTTLRAVGAVALALVLIFLIAIVAIRV